MFFNIFLPSTRRSSKLPLSFGFPHQKPCRLCTSVSPIRATCPAHISLLDLMTQIKIIAQYKWRSSSLCSLLHSPVTSSLLGPNIFLSAVFSNTLRLCSSLNVTDHVSHPHKTAGRLTVPYILISVFLDSEQDWIQNILDWMAAGIFWF